MTEIKNVVVLAKMGLERDADDEEAVCGLRLSVYGRLEGPQEQFY